MIATTVREVTEALQRFNPNARLKCDIVIDGMSPAVRCDISDKSSLASAAHIDRLEEENKDLDSRVDELRLALKKVKEISKANEADAHDQICRTIDEVW